MTRTRNPEIQTRNDAMYAEWLRGASVTSLAARNGIARQVAARIIASYHPEGPEDEDRALFRGYMWRLYDEAQEIGEHPGYKLTPTGRPAEDPDGEPALDTNVQVQVKELQLKILRELRLLDARDKSAKPHTPPDLAQQQAAADIARRVAERASEIAEDERRRRQLEAQSRQIEEQRRELERIARVTGATVPGEVLARELPSAGG